MAIGDNLHEQLASLHSVAVEIAGLHALSDIHDRALDHCLELTESEFAFTGLLRETNVGIVASGEMKVSDTVMDVAAIKGFVPSPEFYELFHQMALRSSVVGIAINENRSYVSNDVPRRSAQRRTARRPPTDPQVPRRSAQTARHGHWNDRRCQ